jgi:cytoskeleton protein RodZ
MSQTLGEKLRQAREARGISVSEVAEQTRISPLYISSIEKDDYKPLPGGIFNKGFVKSYAKFIGIDEHEALQDYATIVSRNEGGPDEDLRTYRPEVLTDDSSASSMVPTIIFAGIILALMTGGILFGIRYLQGTDSPPEAINIRPANNSTSTNTAAPLPETGSGVAPTMGTMKAEFTAATVEISLSSVTDGKNSVALVSGGSSVTFEPKESLKLAYSKDRAESARLKINGKDITLPLTPAVPARRTIEIEINKDNLPSIWQNGRISFENETSSSTPETAPPTPEAASTQTPAAAGPTAPAQTPRPARPTPRPATPAPATPQPVPTRRVIVVPSANRPE